MSHWTGRASKQAASWFLPPFVFLELTLVRATSGTLARCRGWWPPPPPSIFALEPNLAPKSCFPTRWHQFQLIWHLFRILFSPKITKKWQKLKTYQKLLEMNQNSNFCNFWGISTCNTSKENIFHIEFKFKQKNRICLKKN